MIIPQITVPNATVAECSVTLEWGHDDPSGSLKINIIDEGAGHFAEISQEVPGHPIRLGTDQIKAISDWIGHACKIMDEEAARGRA